MLCFLRSAYPRMPEEWVFTIVQHLLSHKQLAFTAAHLGIKDLVTYADGPLSNIGVNRPIAPPSLVVLADALLALCVVLYRIEPNAGLLFIRDFLLTPLADLDMTGELIHINQPMQLLMGMLAADNRAAPESRLQHQCGMNTLLSCFQVGIYSDKKLIGDAPGETVEIAEHEAACQAIRNLIGLSEYRPPLPLNGPLQPPDMSTASKENVSLQTYLKLAQTGLKRDIHSNA